MLDIQNDYSYYLLEIKVTKYFFTYNSLIGGFCMAYTYEELSKMTVMELRKIADGIDHEATKGHSTMHKDKLLPALCQALGIEAHVHHFVKGNINKTKIKSEIKQLKVKRSAAIETKDYTQLKEIRDQIHKLKHTLRKYIV